MRNVHLSRDRATGEGMCGESMSVRMALPRARLGASCTSRLDVASRWSSAAALLMASAAVARQESGQNAATGALPHPQRPAAEPTRRQSGSMRSSPTPADVRCQGCVPPTSSWSRTGPRRHLTDVEFRTVPAAQTADIADRDRGGRGPRRTAAGDAGLCVLPRRVPCRRPARMPIARATRSRGSSTSNCSRRILPIVMRPLDAVDRPAIHARPRRPPRRRWRLLRPEGRPDRSQHVRRAVHRPGPGGIAARARRSSPLPSAS